MSDPNQFSNQNLQVSNSATNNVTPTQPKNNYSNGGFKGIVGRDATQAENDFYGQAPDWEAQLRKNTPQADQDAAAKAGQPQGAPTSPTSATGGIPPPPPAPPPVAAPAQAPQAAPQATGAVPDARTAAPVAAAPTYTPQQISQFQAPDQSAMNGQQSQLMSAILARPETMDATAVAQQKEMQKEQALLLGKQDNAQYAQGAVARGTLGSGRTDAFRGNSAANVNNAILSGNRATDQAALATNRQDQLNALGASSALQQDQLGRATSAYGTGLQGQLANASEQQMGYKSRADANNAAYQRAMGMAQNAQSVYGQDLGAEFGRNANNLDLAKFLESQQQFTRNLNQNASQFNSGLGYQYNALDQSGNLAQQQNILNAIYGKG